MKTFVSNSSEQDRETGFQPNFCGSTRHSGVFARPNLKVFVLGAIIILVVQALIPDESTADTRIRLAVASGRQVDINQLLETARKRPSCELYTLISEHYERMGDLRLAMQYLRMADEAESAADR